MGIAYCGLGLILFFSRFLIFRQNSLRAVLEMYLNWMGLPSSPCHTQVVFCDNPWRSVLTATFPLCCAELRCAWEVSPVPALSLPPDRWQALFSGCVSLLFLPWNGSKALPYLTGWLTLNLFIMSKGSFWIPMIFYIQIANMIADLV